MRQLADIATNAGLNEFMVVTGRNDQKDERINELSYRAVVPHIYVGHSNEAMPESRKTMSYYS